jgi:HK97 family phage portal protein
MAFSFRKLFRLENRVAPVSPSAFFHGIPGWAITDGLRFTANEALAVSAVWGCVMVITRAIAASPWNVFELDAKGRRIPRNAKNDTVYWLLNVQPNPETTAIAFKEALCISAIATGNGYAEIQRDAAFRPAFLWPLEADRMQLMRETYAPFELYYQYTDGAGQVRRLELDDVLHFRGPSSSAILGDDAVSRFVRTIALQIAIQKFSIAYFANGANSNLVLSHPKSLSKAAAERLRADVKERQSGPNKAGVPLVLEEGMSATPISMNMVEAGVTDLAKLGVVDICRIFQVPPHLIGHMDGGTGQYNNLEASSLGFVRDCLTPWARRLEQEVAVKLLGGRGGANRVNEIQLNWLSRGDAVSRATAAKMLREAGIISADEVRRQEGLEEWGGPEGESLLIQSGYSTVDRVLNPPAPAPAVAPAAPQDPEEPEEDEDMTEETDDVEVSGYAQALIGACLERYGARVRACRRAVAKDHGPEEVEALVAEERARLAPKVEFEITAALKLAGRPAAPEPLAVACASVEAGIEAEKAAFNLWSST